MKSIIWDKYQKLEEINENWNIKTYRARIEPIIKEISYKNRDDYYLVYRRIEKLKSEIKIYDIIEEENKIYIVIDNNNNEKLLDIDKILKDEAEIKKEIVLENEGSPVSKKEIMELFKKEKSMYKIRFESIENNKTIRGTGSGFFCELDNFNFPIKYALFTNNQFLKEINIQKGKTI